MEKKPKRGFSHVHISNEDDIIHIRNTPIKATRTKSQKEGKRSTSKKLERLQTTVPGLTLDGPFFEKKRKENSSAPSSPTSNDISRPSGLLVSFPESIDYFSDSKNAFGTSSTQKLNESNNKLREKVRYYRKMVQEQKSDIKKLRHQNVELNEQMENLYDLLGLYKANVNISPDKRNYKESKLEASDKEEKKERKKKLKKADSDHKVDDKEKDKERMKEKKNKTNNNNDNNNSNNSKGQKKEFVPYYGIGVHRKHSDFMYKSPSKTQSPNIDKMKIESKIREKKIYKDQMRLIKLLNQSLMVNTEVSENITVISSKLRKLIESIKPKLSREEMEGFDSLHSTLNLNIFQLKNEKMIIEEKLHFITDKYTEKKINNENNNNINQLNKASTQNILTNITKFNLTNKPKNEIKLENKVENNHENDKKKENQKEINNKKNNNNNKNDDNNIGDDVVEIDLTNIKTIDPSMVDFTRLFNKSKTKDNINYNYNNDNNNNKNVNNLVKEKSYLPLKKMEEEGDYPNDSDFISNPSLHLDEFDYVNTNNEEKSNIIIIEVKEKEEKNEIINNENNNNKTEITSTNQPNSIVKKKPFPKLLADSFEKRVSFHDNNNNTNNNININNSGFKNNLSVSQKKRARALSAKPKTKKSPQQTSPQFRIKRSFSEESISSWDMNIFDDHLYAILQSEFYDKENKEKNNNNNGNNNNNNINNNNNNNENIIQNENNNNNIVGKDGKSLKESLDLSIYLEKIKEDRRNSQFSSEVSSRNRTVSDLMFNELDFAVVNGKQCVVSGHISSIREWVIERSIDFDELGAFFICFREYSSCCDLLEVIFTKFKEMEEELVVGFGYRLFDIINYWIHFFIWDFLNDKILYQKLIDFLENVKIDEFLIEANTVRNFLVSRVTMKRRELECEIIMASPRSLKAEMAKIEILSISPAEIARQLTLLEYNLFTKVNPLDCLDAKLRTTQSVDSIIRRFNQVSMWVATEIVVTFNVKKRASLIKHFIQVAKEAEKLNNFNTLLEITAGLNLSMIQRLKKTWKLIPSKIIKSLVDMEALMDTKLNYQKYRNTLKSAKLPVLPYFGIFLRDLTMIDVGNEEMKGGIVNFEKRKLQITVTNEMVSFQSISYNFKPLQHILNYLSNVSPFDDTTLQKYSIQCERSEV